MPLTFSRQIDSIKNSIAILKQQPTPQEFLAAKQRLTQAQHPLRSIKKADCVLFAREIFYRVKILDVGQKSSALTYTFTLSLVPLLAIAFAFFNFFGGLKLFSEGTLKPLIRAQFLSDISKKIEVLLDTFIANIQTETLGAVAFATFLVTVISLLLSVEKNLNSVFDVVHNRSVLRRFINYWIIISFTPLVFVFSLAKSSEIITWLNLSGHLINSDGFTNFLRFIFGNAMEVLGFSFVYAVLPNRRSSWAALAIGGILATFLFNMLAHANILLSQNVISNAPVNQLYGSIPLFAIIFFAWIRYIWQVILIGACATAAANKILPNSSDSAVNMPQPAFALTRCANILAIIVAEYETNSRGSTPEMIIDKMDLEQIEVWSYIDWLETSQFVFNADESSFVRILPTHKGLKAAQDANIFFTEMSGVNQLISEPSTPGCLAQQVQRKLRETI